LSRVDEKILKRDFLVGKQKVQKLPVPILFLCFTKPLMVTKS